MAANPRPLPWVTPDNKQFWDYTKKHELRMQKCSDCGHIRYPAGIICPKCYSDKYEWVKMSGKGAVYTFGITHYIYDKYFTDKVPYVVAVIELAEGPHMMGNVTGYDRADLKIGSPVELYFEDASEEITLPVWQKPK